MSHVSLSFLVFRPQLKIYTNIYSRGGASHGHTNYVGHGKRKLEQLPRMPK